MESRLYRQIDRELRIQGQAVTTVLSSRLIAEITPTVLDALLGNDGTQDRIYVWVHLVDGRTSVTNAPTLALPNDRPEGRDTWTTTLQGIEYRGIHYQPSPSDGRRGVTLARPSRHLHAELHRSLLFLLGLAVAVVVIATLMVLAAVHWALRPANRAAELIRDFSRPGGVDAAAIRSLAVPRELATFKQALTEMMDRVHQFVERQKQFSANAAHELRTPLTSAKSTLQSLAYGVGNREQCANAIAQAVGDLDRMARLVEQLQTLASLDEGDHIPMCRAIPLDRLLTLLVDTYVKTHPGQVTFTATGEAFVHGEETLLTCLFTNLIDNALKHGPVDGPVTVRLSYVAAHVRVAIHDTGGHLPAAVLSRLTERFFRADAARRRSTGGVGLGLAIAREIGDKHGAVLQFDSQPHSGTTVSCVLPAIN